MPDKPADESPYDFAEPPPKKKPEVPSHLQARKERPTAKPADTKPPARETGELPLAPEPPPAPRSKPQSAEPASAVDDTLRTCLHCGYSFRGKPKARCPECAGPMESASDLMQFADTGWVRKSAWGFIIMVVATLLHIAGAIFNRLDILAGSGAGPEMAHAKGAAHLVGAILMVVGVFLATRRQPGIAGGGMGVELCARLLSLVVLVVWVIAAGYAFDVLHPGSDPDSRVHIKKMLSLAALFPQGVMCGLMAVFCRRLAVRIPNDSIASQSYYSGWLAGVVCWVLFAIVALEMDRGFFPMFFMCSFPMIFGMVVLLLWAAITLIRMALDMRNSAVAGDAIAYKRAERAAAEKKPRSSR